MSELIIGIGGNKGDRLKNLDQASGLLEEKTGRIREYSRIIESEPWGFESGNWFLNRILIIETDKNPFDLIKICLAIEESMGRERTEEYSDRVIDVDILFYDQLLVSGRGLTIPHPRLHERLFILETLNEIRPDMLHPVFGKTINELLENCRDDSKIRWHKSDHSIVLLP